MGSMEAVESGFAERAAALLAAHGERFMSLFDDHDTPSATAKLSTSHAGKAGAGHAPTANATDLHAAGAPGAKEQPSRGSKRKRKSKGAAAGALPTRAPDAAAVTAGDRGQQQMSTQRTLQAPRKRQKQQQQQQRFPETGSGVDPDDIDTLDDMIARRKHSLAVAAAAAARAASRGGSSMDADGRRAFAAQGLAGGGAAGSGPLQARPASIVDVRRERKLFMSSKPGHVHAAVKGSSTATLGVRSVSDGVDMDDGLQLSADAFAKLHTEVEVFGASALDKKARKKWETQQLQKLGSKGHVGPAMAARIGKGVAAKREQRAQRALEEACAAGMVKRKGLGRKRREDERAKVRDPGLQESGPSFRNGVLRLHGSPVPKSSGGGSGRRPSR